MKHKSKLRLCIEILDATHRGYKVWLSAIGVDWYPKASAASPFEGGAVVTLKPGTDVLFDALQEANAGDQFVLEPGDYLESRIIILSVPNLYEKCPGQLGKFNTWLSLRSRCSPTHIV